MNRYAWALGPVLIFSPAAVASVVGTAHETELADAGSACSACHIPHQAAGEKFWAQELVLEGKVGTISAMCASCHHSGEGYGALMTRAHSDDHVYGPNSHGQKMYLADPPTGTDALASGLPDVSPEHGYFECSTCHSVHDNTYRPFLRADPNTLCARCHRQRHYVNGMEKSGPGVEPGRWGLSANTGTNNPGSHPVGEDVDGTREDAPVLVIPEIFRIPLFTAPGEWSLGGHLTSGDSGGVTCLTCHSVHGVETDRDAAGPSLASTPPAPNFLTVEQATATIAGYSREIANGAGDSSILCEACHGVGNNPSLGPTGDGWADNDHNISPGRPGAFSHPVDTYPSSIKTGVDAFPSNWPAGPPSLASENVAVVPICGSCHAAHPLAAAQAGRADVDPGAAASILRAARSLDQGEPICDRCHGEEVANHHPVGKAYDSSGVAYLDNTVAGQGDILTCSTCHSSAHNWTAPGRAAMASGWLPPDNGRRDTQEGDMYDPDLSKTCMDCHYFMDGDGSSVSPTLGSQQTVIPASADEYDHYQTPDRSMGTHYIGRIQDGGEWRSEPLIDAFDPTRTWKEQSPGSQYDEGLAPGWARFGGEDADGDRVLVCESCHELEPDRNAGFRHLLLAPYGEGLNGVDEYAGDVDGHDILCEACHGIPRNTHPMTGMTVSRTGSVLNVSAAWLLPTPLGYATMAGEINAMSCDSCHQPHDANSPSATFMLDAPESGPVGAHLGAPVEAGTLDPLRPSEHSGMGYYQAGDGTLGNYATPTLADKGGDYSGFCRQCHSR